MEKVDICRKHNWQKDCIGRSEGEYKLFCLYCAKDDPNCDYFFPIKEAAYLKLESINKAIASFSEKEESRKARSKEMLSKLHKELQQLKEEKQANEQDISDYITRIIQKIRQYFGEASEETFTLYDKSKLASYALLHTQRPHELINAKEVMQKAMKSQDLNKILEVYKQNVNEEMAPVDIASKDGICNIFAEIQKTTEKIKARRDFIYQILTWLEGILAAGEGSMNGGKVIENLVNKVEQEAQKAKELERKLSEVQLLAKIKTENLNNLENELKAKSWQLEEVSAKIAALKQKLDSAKLQEGNLETNLKILQNTEKIKESVSQVNTSVLKEIKLMECKFGESIAKAKEFGKSSTESVNKAMAISMEQMKAKVDKVLNSVEYALNTNITELKELCSCSTEDTTKVMRVSMEEQAKCIEDKLTKVVSEVKQSSCTSEKEIISSIAGFAKDVKEEVKKGTVFLKKKIDNIKAQHIEITNRGNIMRGRGRGEFQLLLLQRSMNKKQYVEDKYMKFITIHFCIIFQRSLGFDFHNTHIVLQMQKQKHQNTLINIMRKASSCQIQ
eukprot:TRINITY_DN4610_c0_g2_i1.p1 TRINITY_DN4610_c0_g2~~TRINITY_DN4610_c0_g2_i1.p1  ORF type:complete len:596 (-),score=85.45 TRINITY_DN4610_c0_g2_i1:118-1794(-)